MAPGNDWSDAEPGNPPRRSISVVVTHYEQASQLRRVLRALRDQSVPADQIVVADDGSRDPPTAPPDVEVVTQPHQGFRASAARNRAARRCRGELLVFLDADTAPEPTYLEQITAPLLRHPDLLAVGRRRYVELASQDATATGRELTEPAWLRQGYADSDDLRRADETSYRFVIAAVMACSRWWFEEIGGFDEEFTRYGGEDWELAHRSWLSGGLLAHVRGAVAWHDGPAAGEAGRPLSSPQDQLAQTVAVATRVGAPGATYRGLLLGPPEVVVTVAPGLEPAEVVATVDSLLQAEPRATVSLTGPAGELLADDPRVSVAAEEAQPDPGAWLDTSLRLHLHLTRPVTGDRAAWASALGHADGVDPAARTTITSVEGRPCAVLHDLRQYRRARRWGGDGSVLPHHEVTSSLHDAGGRTLQAWLQV